MGLPPTLTYLALSGLTERLLLLQLVVNLNGQLHMGLEIQRKINQSQSILNLLIKQI